MLQTKRILSFWFGEHPIEDEFPSVSQKWFSKSSEFDSKISHQFKKYLIETASNFQQGKLTAEDRLALIILFDQFSRNIFREMPQAFQYDPLAFKFSNEMISQNEDEKFFSYQRTFIYMPWVHSEELKHQDRAVELFELLLKGTPQKIQPRIRISLDYAIRHRDIIKRFGRFPHRNKILSRASTTEEIEFLKTPGSSF